MEAFWEKRSGSSSEMHGGTNDGIKNYFSTKGINGKKVEAV